VVTSHFNFLFYTEKTTRMRLKDKVAIITGGARGIGKAAAEIFTKEGAKVVIWDMLDAGMDTAEALDAEFYKISVTDVPAIEAAAQAVVDKFGQIDILINNAGITRDKSFMKMTYAEWQQVIDVNLTGVFNCTKAVAPFMVARGYGRIICTSSIVGVHGAFGQTNYAAAKAGLIAMCRTWAKELGPKGITANAVAPGFIQTDMTDAIPEEVRQAQIRNIPARRVGLPEDIGYTYLFLASDEASYINGQVIGVNGGVGL
jgi:3-oxoacyl-[acyl-carrier protein] reductase